MPARVRSQASATLLSERQAEASRQAVKEPVEAQREALVRRYATTRS
jgi:hypothetical protein